MKPYLDLILSGEKTVECRLTVQDRPPFNCIEPGHRLFFKQSSGPYRATATVEHVICESDLTPRRVGELKRDYNELIRGEDSFWAMKRDSRYATLIWLAEVEATDSGPPIRPLQGLAWVTLDERGLAPPAVEAEPRKSGPARRVVSGGSGGMMSPFAIELTAGNIRNNSLYVSGAMDRLPGWAVGGRTKKEAARPLTLILHDGPTVESDVVGPRKLLRTRVWGKWYARHAARPGDFVVFTPVDETTYFVGMARRSSS